MAYVAEQSGATVSGKRWKVYTASSLDGSWSDPREHDTWESAALDIARRCCERGGLIAVTVIVY